MSNVMANALLYIFIGIAIFLMAYVTQRFGFKQDNPVEEVAEEVIKAKTGLDVDLTPNSPEKKDELQ